MNNEDKEFYELTMKLLEAAEAVIQQDSATNRGELRAAAHYLRMHPNSIQFDCGCHVWRVVQFSIPNTHRQYQSVYSLTQAKT